MTPRLKIAKLKFKPSAQHYFGAPARYPWALFRGGRLVDVFTTQSQAIDHVDRIRHDEPTA